MRPLIGLTPGDSLGIGPELILKVLSQPRLHASAQFVVIGDAEFMERAQNEFHRKSPRHFRRFKIASLETLDSAEIRKLSSSVLAVLDLKKFHPTKIKWGTSSALSGKAAGDYIESAVKNIRAGNLDALVTLPLNKKSFFDGGWGKKYKGHTEMLAALSKTKEYSLMMIYNGFRVSHVTQHIPLAKVASRINKKSVMTTIALTWNGLKRMGIKKPRIGVCGLNPHAGDEGVLGTEELRVIIPAIRSMSARNIDVAGPLSADIFWPRLRDGEFDAGVAMYHDQGQIPFKMLAFSFKETVQSHGVNVTLGLPFIRTSVAHGTAFDIAGRGIADAGSFLDAISLAIQMVKQ